MARSTEAEYTIDAKVVVPTSMKDVCAEIEPSKDALLPWSYSDNTKLFSHYQTQTYEFLQTGVDEIVQVAYKIYSSQLARVNKGESPITLVAPGQSPSYLAFTMLNLPIYDASKVNMIVLPMSSLKFRDPLNPSGEVQEWMRIYMIQMLTHRRELVESIRSNLVIIDNIGTGTSWNIMRIFFKFMHNYKIVEGKFTEQSFWVKNQRIFFKTMIIILISTIFFKQKMYSFFTSLRELGRL